MTAIIAPISRNFHRRQSEDLPDQLNPHARVINTSLQYFIRMKRLQVTYEITYWSLGILEIDGGFLYFW